MTMGPAKSLTSSQQVVEELSANEALQLAAQTEPGHINNQLAEILKETPSCSVAVKIGKWVTYSSPSYFRFYSYFEPVKYNKNDETGGIGSYPIQPFGTDVLILCAPSTAKLINPIAVSRVFGRVPKELDKRAKEIQSKLEAKNKDSYRQRENQNASEMGEVTLLFINLVVTDHG